MFKLPVAFGADEEDSCGDVQEPSWLLDKETESSMSSSSSLTGVEFIRAAAAAAAAAMASWWWLRWWKLAKWWSWCPSIGLNRGCMMILSTSKGIEKTLSVENEESSTTECVCERAQAAGNRRDWVMLNDGSGRSLYTPKSPRGQTPPPEDPVADWPWRSLTGQWAGVAPPISLIVIAGKHYGFFLLSFDGSRQLKGWNHSVFFFLRHAAAGSGNDILLNFLTWLLLRSHSISLSLTNLEPWKSF